MSHSTNKNKGSWPLALKNRETKAPPVRSDPARWGGEHASDPVASGTCFCKLSECLLPGVPGQAARADTEEKLRRSSSHLSESRATMLKKDEETAALRDSLARLVTVLPRSQR